MSFGSGRRKCWRCAVCCVSPRRFHLIFHREPGCILPQHNQVTTSLTLSEITWGISASWNWIAGWARGCASQVSFKSVHAPAHKHPCPWFRAEGFGPSGVVVKLHPVTLPLFMLWIAWNGSALRGMWAGLSFWKLGRTWGWGVWCCSLSFL